MGDGMPLNLLELTQEQAPMVWPLMVVIRGAVQFSSRIRGGGWSQHKWEKWKEGQCTEFLEMKPGDGMLMLKKLDSTSG